MPKPTCTTSKSRFRRRWQSPGAGPTSAERTGTRSGGSTLSSSTGRERESPVIQHTRSSSTGRERERPVIQHTRSSSTGRERESPVIRHTGKERLSSATESLSHERLTTGLYCLQRPLSCLCLSSSRWGSALLREQSGKHCLRNRSSLHCHGT